MAADEFLTTIEVAKRISVGVDTLEKWRAAGDGPPWYRFGRVAVGPRGRKRARTLPRYRREDVDAWIATKRQDGRTTRSE